jgi:ribosome-associated translation inhibitor RaiA
MWRTSSPHRRIREREALMLIRVSSANNSLDSGDIDQIEKDLEKIDRRLGDVEDVYAEVRIKDGYPSQEYTVTIDLDYRRNHLIAKASDRDMGQAVRMAREEILRQINDRSKGGHSSFTKGR